jgi:tetratricopeptide (TPR) repeat protein
MGSSAEVLAQARQQHQSGNLAQAERLYREVLRLEPGNALVLFFLGTACHQQERTGEAIALYRQALRLQPDLAEAYNNLGVLYKSQYNFSDAIPCFQQALRFNPCNAQAHNNLGNAYQQLSHAKEAVPCYREALRLLPDYAEAHNNLGAALRDQGKMEEALACYREALRLNPNYAEAFVNLGVAISEQGKIDEAVSCYRRALQLQPNMPDVHHNLSDAFLEQGKLADALFHTQETLRLNPDYPHALYNQALLAVQGWTTFPDSQVQRTRRLLAGANLLPSHASLLHFALANVLSGRGRYDEAFAHYREANILRRNIFHETGTVFNAQYHEQHIDRLIGFFDTEFFRRVQYIGSDSEVPVFIVGMPRSGTTLVEQILSNHPQIHGAGELNDMNQVIAALPAHLGTEGGFPDYLARLDQRTAPALTALYLERLAELGGRAARVTDKMPENYLHLGVIAALCPRARVIHCRRDTMDVCLSCYFQNFKGLPFAWDLEDIGRYHVLYERLMAHWRAVLPLRMCDLVYEDLVADQEGVSRRLLAFCGLEWDARCLAFHDNQRPVQTASKLQVRKPLHSGSLGKWRRYEAHLAPLLKIVVRQ